MSLYAFDINDVIDLNQTCENQSIDLNVNEDEWKLVRQQLLTPTPSVCDERPISRCESVMLFNRINDVGEDECIDLESNDLKEFLDTQSILLKDYSSSPMTHFTLKSDKKLQDLKKRINSSKPPVIENEKIRNILAKRRLDQSFLNQKRRSFEENSSKPDSEQVRLMVNNPATEQTTSKPYVIESAKQLLASIQERKKNSLVIDGRLHLLDCPSNKKLVRITTQQEPVSQSNHKARYFSKRLDFQQQGSRQENEYRAFLLSRLPQPISYRCNE